jgi:hypothetical protein
MGRPEDKWSESTEIALAILKTHPANAENAVGQPWRYNLKK